MLFSNALIATNCLFGLYSENYYYYVLLCTQSHFPVFIEGKKKIGTSIYKQRIAAMFQKKEVH